MEFISNENKTAFLSKIINEEKKTEFEGYIDLINKSKNNEAAIKNMVDVIIKMNNSYILHISDMKNKDEEEKSRFVRNLIINCDYVTTSSLEELKSNISINRVTTSSDNQNPVFKYFEVGEVCNKMIKILEDFMNVVKSS